ncbi:hypothetical protein ACFSOZ_12720 [Mesorhizobium newzealandense]|uniref:Uncharacterized protein n=1 Tax=Mesorhizobium newzealandense TaxID=1300302 RepID=A0ABW4UAJ5_9HYPH
MDDQAAAFRERFGDFESRRAVGIHIGPGPRPGDMMGLIFDLAGGGTVKVAIHTDILIDALQSNGRSKVTVS